MEMGKHIIVFITAILMPFMAYGANCSGVPENTCNTTKGCEWIVDEISGDGCEPCDFGKYNAGGDGSSGCTDCTNAPKGCGTDDNPSCDWMQGEAYTGQISNACPWEMNNVDMTITYLGSEPINIFATLSNVDDGNTTDNETKLVIKISDENKNFSTISDYSNKNQIKTEIQLNNSKTCTINRMEHDYNQWTLVSDDCSLSNTQILSPSLTVTAKQFKYVFVPTNSVEPDNEFSVDSAGNASGVKDGYFGAQIDRTNIDETVKYYQYNNCKYYKTTSTVNCEFDDNTKPKDPSNKINYEFTYIDKDTYGNPIDTIIVLELHCPADSYCSDYKTVQSCPKAFSSAKDSATSKTDCYLDNNVKFFDNNNTNGVQLIPQGKKVYYRGNSTQ